MDAQELLAAHVAEWASLWEGGVEVSGNATVALTLNVTFYAILSSLRDDTPLGCSPSGLARNEYEGHSFWDCETWILPALVLQWPAVARSMTQYRYDRLGPALKRAASRGLKGAMWPWESALTGFDMCGPGQTEGTNEVHISADVPLSFRLHYLMTRNESWLRTHAWPVARASADFFASRAVLEPISGNYTQKQVVTPDEEAGIVDDAAYTNAAAARTMQFAGMIARKLKLPANPQWAVQSARPYLPVTNLSGAGGAVHPEFSHYSGMPIAQASVALMQYQLRNINTLIRTLD
jgi:trehalose/maltose hydrolase-like predicted phosphorylase